MIEKSYQFQRLDAKCIEKLIDDDQLLLNHIIIPKGEGLPTHFSNSNVYLIIVRGNMTLTLNEQEPHLYNCGQIVNIPDNTKMKLNNFNDAVLEFFIIKCPNPRNFGG